MFDESKSYGGGMWLFFFIFLILIWGFGGNAGFGGWGRGAYAGPWMAQNEVTPWDNSRALSSIQCTLSKDTAVLEGQLETAFRQIINNDNQNTATILAGQKDLYIKQLERENTQLFVVGENEKTRNQALLLKADTDAKLASISCNMLQRPPVYPTVCVPCAVNSCNSSCGYNGVA